MFTARQKQVLFGTAMRHRPQYVRVPLQTVNGVHELKSDLQFERILPAYEQAKVQLLNHAADRPIFHIRVDATSKIWLPNYEKICAAFRSLNCSRILRRMRISGFRLINVTCFTYGYRVASDSFICGLDEACVILDALAQMFLPSGRESLYVRFRCSPERLKIIRAAAVNSPDWLRSWTLETRTVDSCMLKLTAPAAQIVTALNYLLATAEKPVESVRFTACSISMDLNNDLGKELRQRHGETDINVLLSGYRLRRFQKFGTLTKRM